MTKLFNIDTRNWLILGLILFIIILFFWKPCNKPDEKIEAIKAENKQLQERHIQDSIQFSRQVTRWQDSITHADINSDLQAKVMQETEKKLLASQRDINRLTAIIRNAPSKPDSSFVLVSPDYKDACDSLPNKIDSQNVVIADLKQDKDDLIDLMNYEVVYRDSLIESGKGYIDSLRSDYNAQKVLLNQALKAAKPRGRLLGGVGLIGNETNPLGGTKINIAYQSKGGKQYQIGGILMRGGVWYEATVFVTLIK